MKKYEFKDLLSNIEISEDEKQDLYENCINRKRTSDFTFRYSQLLLVLIAVTVFSVLSIGAAAAVMSVRERMENMSEEEYGDYAYEVENDTFISVDEGFSRELTDNEILRIIELERSYYDDGVFPAAPLPHLQTKAELQDGMLAYVAADNLVYMPEGDMDDEQILQYIDHDAKKRYINRQSLIEEGYDTESSPYLTSDSTPLTAGSREYEAREAAEKYLMDMYGVDIKADDKWIVLVEFFEGEHYEEGPDTEDLYQLDFYKNGTGYATAYQLRLRADDLEPLLISVVGYEQELRAKKYTAEEAEALKESAYESAVRFLKDTAGLGEPDDFRFEDGYEEDPSQISALSLSFKYSDKHVFVRIRLEDKKVMDFVVH